MKRCGSGGIFGISARQPGGRDAPCLFSWLPRFSIFPALLLFLLFLNALLFTTFANAQQGKPGVLSLGDLVVTGFSGSLPPPPNPPLPPGVNALDETFIDPNGASLKIFDASNPGGPPTAQLLNAPEKFQAFARDIGQVFGLALDKSNPANIFAASTSVHGLQIVVPDADGDGRPERIKLGQPGAQWMDGQFGAALGGGPGTIWKINGETGEVTKFADILGNGAPNSGPGLGNIAYDAKHKQLFVSDFDTGFIHRFNMAGTDLGTYDHGLQGRPANGLNAAPDDGVRTDIASPAFDAEDSSSWGMTSPERRVWGLAVRGNRLYYSVEEGPQIWSLGINADGSFGGDPRWELDVPADPKAYPVSDIAFQSNGLMLLAQRGGIASRYDYSQYHTPRKTRILRYSLESPNDPATPSRWVAAPDDYAIGFPGIHRNTSGGIAIGYGYKKNRDGSYGLGSCEGTLWSTGDALRDNPVHSARLAQGGPLNVHGLQGNALSLIRPQNVPPWTSYFVDYDSQFDDTQASGHVGDVEIPRRCGGKRVDVMDLRIHKHAIPERCSPGNACAFEIEIINSGSLTYSGPLVIQDIAHNGSVLVGHKPPPPFPGWNCRELFPGSGIYQCDHPGVTLKPGQKISLELTFKRPGWWKKPVYDNCVDLRVPGAGVDQRPYNNRSCDYVAFCTPGEPGCAPDLQLEKFGRYGACDFFGLCEFSVLITNVGPAPFTGLLHVSDIATTPGATITDWSPKPEWNCAANGPDKYGCSTNAPVTLTPGEFRELIIFVQGPPIAPGITHVRNCAFIDWNGPPGDPNPHNEFACAEISNLPPGHPDARAQLLIQKSAAGATCFRLGAGGVGDPWSCGYRVAVNNIGTAPLMGPIEFTDKVNDLPATLGGFFGAPPGWNCVAGPGPAGTFTCTYPAIAGGLLPGDGLELWLFFDLAAATPVPNWEQNCATVKFDNNGDGIEDEIESCATAYICDPGSGDCPNDLAVTKDAQIGACKKGDKCAFGITIENISDAMLPGPLVVTDVPDAGVGAPEIYSAGWACAPAGGTYTCTNPAGIPANSVAVLGLGFPIPLAYSSALLNNCAKVAPGPGNDLAFNDESCALASVTQPFPADLSPWSNTECERGAACQLPGKIKNNGEQVFTGAAGVIGVLSPDLPITAIVSKTHGFTCAKTGNAAYECQGSNLSIKPGSAVEYELTVSVPANYPHSKVNHVKDMIWPDRKVKDKNPSNDQHTSVITIKQPDKPTPPPPPPPPAGKPDLAVSKTANQTSSRAGGPSGFTVTVSNVGAAPYSGPIAIRDTINPGSSLTAVTPPWKCRRSQGSYLCRSPAKSLQPGQSIVLGLTFTLPRNASGGVNNCAELSWGTPGQTGGSLRDVQAELSARGFNPGVPDGKMGKNTRNAIRAYEAQNNLRPTGRVSAALLNALFGGASSGGDSNPANDRACARSAITGAVTPPPPPPPPQCTGGKTKQYIGGRLICACPSHKPDFIRGVCRPRIAPPPPPPPQCTGGKTKQYIGGRLICACPANRPNFINGVCRPRIAPPPPPPQCRGGQTKQYIGGRLICRCPSNKPNFIGGICLPKIKICSGGRTFNLQKRQCVCPSHKPVWDSKKKKCIPYTTYPIPGTGGGHTTTPRPSEISCSGGRQRIGGKCKCPSSRPIWTGKICAPRLQINPQILRPQVIRPQQNPTLNLPSGTFRIPGGVQKKIR